MGSSVPGIQTSEQPRGRRRTKMGRQVVDLEIQREGNKPWGLRIVGGADVATVMKVEKVLGIDTPAYKAGLKAGDVLVEVQGELITMMTHPQVVNLIRGVRGNTLRLKVERGDHVVPNIQECFPIKTQEACKRGLESRLIPPFFTCIGKMKVLVQSEAALILSKAALLILIVMMMIAIVATLISLG